MYLLYRAPEGRSPFVAVSRAAGGDGAATSAASAPGRVRGRRGGRVTLTAAIAVLGAIGLATTADAAKKPPPANPPVQVIVFPQRDFVSASNFAATDSVSVEVLRGGSVIASAPPQTPRDDPKTNGFDGIVEVNHPGGACWNATPDIIPGDVVRTATAAGVVNQTVTANVTSGAPTNPAGMTIVVHGTAQDALGAQLPLDQIQARLVANKQAFNLSGKRDIRAPGNGTIAYDDAVGPNWTATWQLTNPNDVALAMGAQSRALWRGATPLAGTDAPISEFGATGGPQPHSVPAIWG